MKMKSKRRLGKAAWLIECDRNIMKSSCNKYSKKKVHFTDYATMNIHTDICYGGVTVKISVTYSLQAVKPVLFLSYINPLHYS